MFISFKLMFLLAIIDDVPCFTHFVVYSCLFTLENGIKRISSRVVHGHMVKIEVQARNQDTLSVFYTCQVYHSGKISASYSNCKTVLTDPSPLPYRTNSAIG